MEARGPLVAAINALIINLSINILNSRTTLFDLHQIYQEMVQPIVKQVEDPFFPDI